MQLRKLKLFTTFARGNFQAVGGGVKLPLMIPLVLIDKPFIHND